MILKTMKILRPLFYYYSFVRLHWFFGIYSIRKYLAHCLAVTYKHFHEFQEDNRIMYLIEELPKMHLGREYVLSSVFHSFPLLFLFFALNQPLVCSSSRQLVEKKKRNFWVIIVNLLSRTKMKLKLKISICSQSNRCLHVCKACIRT